MKKKRRFELLVVNHGERQTIERFELTATDGKVALRWAGCTPVPLFFFSSRRRHTSCLSDWSSDVCSSDRRRDLLARRGIRDGSPAGQQVRGRAGLQGAAVARASRYPAQPGSGPLGESKGGRVRAG